MKICFTNVTLKIPDIKKSLGYIPRSGLSDFAKIPEWHLNKIRKAYELSQIEAGNSKE